MSKLLDYINTLDKDSVACAAHTADPAAAMTQFGLSDVEQQAVLSGDSDEIAKLSGVDVHDGEPPQTSNTPFN